MFRSEKEVCMRDMTSRVRTAYIRVRAANIVRAKKTWFLKDDRKFLIKY